MKQATSTREEKKARHRQAILEAAREVFFRDGFMDANLDEVAQLAGVAKGTLYRYFDSKAELYVAVLAESGEVFEQRFRETLDPALPADAQLRRTARFYFEHYTRNRQYFQIFWAVENQSVIGQLPPAVLDQVTRLWEQCLRVPAEIIERGIGEGVFRRCDPWEVANILWVLANGLIETEAVSARRELRGRPLSDVFDDALELFLRGLLRDPGRLPALPGRSA